MNLCNKHQSNPASARISDLEVAAAPESLHVMYKILACTYNAASWKNQLKLWGRWKITVLIFSARVGTDGQEQIVSNWRTIIKSWTTQVPQLEGKRELHWLWVTPCKEPCETDEEPINGKGAGTRFKVVGEDENPPSATAVQNHFLKCLTEPH